MGKSVWIVSMIVTSVTFMMGSVPSLASVGSASHWLKEFPVSTPSGGQETKPAVGLDVLKNATMLDSTCSAWTTCANGVQISCYSDGDSCTWEYSAGAWVYCTETTNGEMYWWSDSC